MPVSQRLLLFGRRERGAIKKRNIWLIAQQRYSLGNGGQQKRKQSSLNESPMFICWAVGVATLGSLVWLEKREKQMRSEIGNRLSQLYQKKAK